MKYRRRIAGFSLLELGVAAILITVSSIGIISLVNYGTKLNNRQRRKIVGTQLLNEGIQIRLQAATGKKITAARSKDGELPWNLMPESYTVGASGTDHMDYSLCSFQTLKDPSLNAEIGKSLPPVSPSLRSYFLFSVIANDFTLQTALSDLKPYGYNDSSSWEHFIFPNIFVEDGTSTLDQASLTAIRGANYRILFTALLFPMEEKRVDGERFFIYEVIQRQTIIPEEE